MSWWRHKAEEYHLRVTVEAILVTAMVRWRQESSRRDGSKGWSEGGIMDSQEQGCGGRHWYAGTDTGDAQVGVLSCAETCQWWGCPVSKGLPPPEVNQELVREGGSGQVKKYVTIRIRAQAPEGSLSEFGTPPPHNLGTLNRLLDGNTHTHIPQSRFYCFCVPPPWIYGAFFNVLCSISSMPCVIYKIPYQDAL